MRVRAVAEKFSAWQEQNRSKHIVNGHYEPNAAVIGFIVEQMFKEESDPDFEFSIGVGQKEIHELVKRLKEENKIENAENCTLDTISKSECVTLMNKEIRTLMNKKIRLNVIKREVKHFAKWLTTEQSGLDFFRDPNVEPKTIVSYFVEHKLNLSVISDYDDFIQFVQWIKENSLIKNKMQSLAITDFEQPVIKKMLEDRDMQIREELDELLVPITRLKNILAIKQVLLLCMLVYAVFRLGNDLSKLYQLAIKPKIDMDCRPRFPFDVNSPSIFCNSNTDTSPFTKLAECTAKADLATAENFIKWDWNVAASNGTVSFPASTAAVSDCTTNGYTGGIKEYLRGNNFGDFSQDPRSKRGQNDAKEDREDRENRVVFSPRFGDF